MTLALNEVRIAYLNPAQELLGLRDPVRRADVS